ncbi:MAG: J domain-containing protein [Pseudomonadota bacterium]
MTKSELLLAYDILGLKPGVGEYDVRRARLNLVRSFHPDTYQGDKGAADRKLAQINAAYDDVMAHLKRHGAQVRMDVSGDAADAQKAKARARAARRQAHAAAHRAHHAAAAARRAAAKCAQADARAAFASKRASAQATAAQARDAAPVVHISAARMSREARAALVAAEAAFAASREMFADQGSEWKRAV